MSTYVALGQVLFSNGRSDNKCKYKIAATAVDATGDEFIRPIVARLPIPISPSIQQALLRLRGGSSLSIAKILSKAFWKVLSIFKGLLPSSYSTFGKKPTVKRYGRRTRRVATKSSSGTKYAGNAKRIQKVRTTINCLVNPFQRMMQFVLLQLSVL